MYIVEVMSQMYFHYFSNGKMIIGHKKHAKILTMDEIIALGLIGYKLEEYK